MFLVILSSLLLSFILSTLFSLNTVVTLIIFSLLIYICKKYLKLNISKRDKIISFILSIFISFLIVSEVNIYLYDSTKLDNLYTFIYILSFIPCIYYFINILFNKIDNLKIKTFNNKLINKLFNNSKYSIIRYALIIFICWLPVIIAFYPGNFSYDAAGQLNQVVTGEFTTHHPLLHTLLIGYTVNFGNDVLNSANAGLFIYSLIQSTIFALSLAYIIDFINTRCKSSIISIITLIMFSLFPMFPVLAVTVTKDILFSSFFIIAFINYLKFSLYGKKAITPINIISTLVFSILAILFRNNGIYAFYLFFPFILIALRKHFKFIVLFIVVTLLSVNLINNSLNRIYKPEEGSIREALSIPIQQLSRTYNEDFLSDSDRKEIKSYFWVNDFSKYNSHISDPIKNCMKKKKIKENLKDFINLWINVGFEHPVTYIDAFLENNTAYLNLFDEIPDKSTYRVFIEISDNEDFGNYDIHFTRLLPNLFGYYYTLLEGGNFNLFPITRIFYNISLYMYLMLFTMIMFIRRKHYKLFSAYTLMLGLFITALLGPVSILRYVLPIVLIAPINFQFVFENKKK